MAWIDEDGLLQPHSGDVLGVHFDLRERDYGPLLTPTGKPLILVWHLTGNYRPETCDDGLSDGSEGMATRIENGARYYAHAILDCAGVFHQAVHFNRSAIAVSGSWKGHEVNRIANHVEVTNLGYVRPNGKMPGGHPVDLERDDLRSHGRLAWEMLTPKQQSAILEFAEAWHLWSEVPIADCLRGHCDVNPSDGHADPGDELRPFLDTAVRAHLEALT